MVGMTISDLYAWRARRGWSQAEAAKRLGYSRRGYQDIEGRDGQVPLRIELAIEGLEAREQRAEHAA